jgi:hypothetical protein
MFRYLRQDSLILEAEKSVIIEDLMIPPGAEAELDRRPADSCFGGELCDLFEIGEGLHSSPTVPARNRFGST